MIIKEPITLAIVKPAAIFNAEIVTENIGLDNFQSAKFVIATGEGTATTVIAQVVACYSEAEGEKVLEEREITIGDNTESSFVIDADKLGHDEFDMICLKIENAGNADILGCIFVVLGNERYSA